MVGTSSGSWCGDGRRSKIDRLVTRLEQLVDDVRADEARPPGDENPHDNLLSSSGADPAGSGPAPMPAW